MVLSTGYTTFGILADLFKIRSKMNCILIGAIMVVFPTIFSTFVFMFTAPYYFFSLLLISIAVYLIKNYDNFLYSFLGGGILISCATGIYQAYFPVAVASLLGLLILETISDRTRFSEIIKIGIKYLCILSLGLFIYLLMTKFFCFIKNSPLSSYQGIDDMGNISIFQLPQLIFNAYKGWFSLLTDINNLSCSPFAIMLYRIFTLIFLIMSIISIFICLKQDKFKGLLLILEFTIFPIAVNLIYIMCPSAGISILMIYGFAIAFLLFTALLENQNYWSDNVKFKKIYVKLCRLGGVSVLIGFISIYIQYANIEYLRSDFLQAQAQSYFTTLISQIKSTADYNEEMPIVFIGEHSEKNLDTYFKEDIYNTGLYPKELKVLINNYVWKTYMMRWCGFSPIIEDETQFKSLPEVQLMNTYPNDNSIRIINNVVVVKLSE